MNEKVVCSLFPLLCAVSLVVQSAVPKLEYVTLSALVTGN